MNVILKNADINTGAQRTRLSAEVDGVFVAWRVRPADKKGPAYTGWICAEHGKGGCDHTDAFEAVLPRWLPEKLERWEGQRNTNNQEV